MSKKTKLILKSSLNESWLEHFRLVDKSQSTYWFWNHFNWQTQSLWIGKLNHLNQLPPKDDQIIAFLKKLLNDLNQTLQNHIYIKFYLTRNINNNEPEINYLMICDSSQLPNEFHETLIDIIFERYQLTEKIINQNENFRSLINHYINWNNYYPYYGLISELHN